MCFGIRISSPFDLNSLNIPIQNIKCPQNTKNHFLPSHYLWSLNCVIFAQACQTQSVWPAMLSMNHNVRCNVFRVPVGSLCHEKLGPYLVLISMICCSNWKKRPRSLSRGTHDSIVMSAHAFLVFLGHLIFWMGMFKVFSWNGLEILISKHMWKSIIGPLEQI